MFLSTGEGRDTPLLGPLERANLNHWTSHVKSKSMLCYDRQSVDQSVLVWDSRTICLFLRQLRVCYYGEPSLTRTRYGQFWTAHVQVQVVLRPTVSRPVRLGVGPPLEQMTRFYISLSGNFSCVAPSTIRPSRAFKPTNSKHRDVPSYGSKFGGIS
jgi:hypothetical protein